ncbi:hypothetical protein DUI87_16402 [Hirundo rustica rustica]|uniref:COMM domain-containing protein 6 n=1 Tax=Hirundo rustica rustica TaxID=333673 RepID=A0A3M0K7B6_HIRRU|nr:hypothetical protein DUI87_16402 [Hirundo rustica rustica]
MAAGSAGALALALGALGEGWGDPVFASNRYCFSDGGGAADKIRLIPQDFLQSCTAARNNLSTEELITTLGSGISTLPKHALQVIRHVWNEQGKAIAVSEDAGNVATVGQFVDMKWKLGVAMSSDTCRSLKYPYVTVTLTVADPSGQITDKSFEMTIPQFKDGLGLNSSITYKENMKLHVTSIQLLLKNSIVRKIQMKFRHMQSFSVMGYQGVDG